MITSLSLHHYKNYANETVRFAPGLNLLVGSNGMGKTNLLDAVYYVCMAKSHSTPHDRDTVQFDHPFFRLEAKTKRNDQIHEVCVKVKPGEIKDISIDGKSVDRLSAYIGFLPVIMLAPEDIVLIEGGSVARRRYLDVVLCQSDKNYLEHLQRYNKLLAQRNALLRTEGNRADRALLMTYTNSMAEPAQEIYQSRETLAKELVPDIIAYYGKLTDAMEKPFLQYNSHLKEQSLDTLAKESLELDLHHGRTMKGIHRDDLEILLDDHPLKRFGSQGQIKSVLVAMHLAQLVFLRNHLGTQPTLLLDDIFDRLDETRAQRLIALLIEESSQIFISDASPSRVQRLLSHSGHHAQVFEIRNGTVRKV